jgi:hypothetical protein
MASDSLETRIGRRAPSLEQAVSALETALNQIEAGQPDAIEEKLKTALGSFAEAAREALR